MIKCRNIGSVFLLFLLAVYSMQSAMGNNLLSDIAVHAYVTQTPTSTHSDISPNCHTAAKSDIRVRYKVCEDHDITLPTIKVFATHVPHVTTKICNVPVSVPLQLRYSLSKLRGPPCYA